MHLLPGPATVLAASTVTTIGATLVVLLIIGLLVYAWVNVRASRAEVGSEIELAPNRKPYYDDDELETRVLNRTLRSALVLLVVIAVALPLYWLNEPGRQSGAEEAFQETFISRGEELYVEGSQCQNCHGPEGTGGQAQYTITDADGEFVATVNWRAPALNTVLLRHTRRRSSTSSTTAVPSRRCRAGARTPARAPQLPAGDQPRRLPRVDPAQPEEARRQAEEALAVELGLAEEGASEEELDQAIQQIDYDDPATGEALFNLEVAGGAYACARCHTRGWSIITEGDDAVTPADADLSDYVGFPDGSGALGPNLTGGLVPRQFATYEELLAFISTGSIDGEPYGNNGIGSGKMPGFGDNPNTEDVSDDGMMSQEMLAAIARYAASLTSEGPVPDPNAPSVEELTAEDEEG